MSEKEITHLANERLHSPKILLRNLADRRFSTFRTYSVDCNRFQILLRSNVGASRKTRVEGSRPLPRLSPTLCRWVEVPTSTPSVGTFRSEIHHQSKCCGCLIDESWLLERLSSVGRSHSVSTEDCTSDHTDRTLDLQAVLLFF